MEADGSDFQDFAFVTEEDVRRVHGDANFGNQKHSNFPVQLHYLLSEMERDGHSEVASWHSHGRSFAVHDKKRFEDEFLPKYVFIVYPVAYFLRFYTVGSGRISLNPSNAS